ncbi:argonaute complex, subunit Arb1 [Rhizophagus irregularis DAOM 181602=DAOM 197198]|nr:argonaute complex, subunit Arb1 [Rhizophagus irregularis DAOM 181602=DAOM 197198]
MKEDENPAGNLLKENKNLNDNKSDTTLVNSTGPKSFLGQDGLDNADADAEEIAARRATEYIDDEADDLEVNFTRYANGLQIAHKAKEELPNCKALAQNAPGKLNKAYSLLFGGELYGMLDGPWNGEEMDISEASADETLQNSNELHNTQETDLKKIKLREFDVSTAEPFYNCVNSDLGIYAMPGMRITADFHKLSNGFWYWDKILHYGVLKILEDKTKMKLQHYFMNVNGSRDFKRGKCRDLQLLVK